MYVRIKYYANRRLAIKMKKIFAILLVAMMILSMVACSNEKKEKETEDEKTATVNQTIDVASGKFEYATNEEGDFEIVKYIPSSPKLVELIELPKTSPDGRDIVGIADDAFKSELSIKAISIPASYTYIGDRAFYDCDNLAKVVMTDNVTSIGVSAFEGCEKLAELTLSKGLTAVNKFTFKNCSSLTAIALADKVTAIADGAFLGCTELATLTLSANVSEVTKNAFYGCDKLAYTVENGAKYLGNAENAYVVLVSAEDLNVESCTVNAKTLVVAENAFSNCSFLKTLVLSDSVKVFSNGCFNNCPELEFNEYENGLYLGTATNEHMVLVGLVNTAVENFKLSSDTKIITATAFEHGYNLEDIGYEKTEADWNAIIKTANWNFERNIIVHCTDKEISPIA
jgi:hypothetical protein